MVDGQSIDGAGERIVETFGFEGSPGQTSWTASVHRLADGRFRIHSVVRTSSGETQERALDFHSGPYATLDEAEKVIRASFG